MALGKNFRKVFAFSITIAVIIGGPAPNAADESAKCRIGLELSNTIAYSHTTTEISVIVNNPSDTIVGFRIWLFLDRPENVIAFRQSGQKFDTSGTLTSGWEAIAAGSISGTGTDIQITGIANLLQPPFTPGIMPQSGGTLIKILADVKEINDPFADSVVGVEINPFFPEHLEVVITDFSWFIWDEQEYWDTIGWVCENWLVDTTVNPPDTIGCTNWVETPSPPWDDFIVVLDTQYVLDTTELCLTSGSIYVLPPLPFLCGDINGDGTAGNILDLNFLVNRIFRAGPDSDPPEASDVNCDGGNGNILDLNLFINRIFRAGPPVCSNPGC